jgi:hypothetical protein
LKQITGWSISILFGALGISIPGGTKAEVAMLAPLPAVSVVSPDRMEEAKNKQVLLDNYSFGEKSERVKNLQRTIGSVRVDGDYGSITRRRHIEKLQSLNLPVSNVPEPPMSAVYNIPGDQTKRCPMWEPLFEEVGLQPVEVFSYIAWRESGCNPAAQNARWDANGNMTYALNKDKSYDTGLLQINSSWKSRVADVCGKDAVENRMSGLKDVRCNVIFAKWIMDNSQGKLGNWRVYKN